MAIVKNSVTFTTVESGMSLKNLTSEDFRIIDVRFFNKTHMVGGISLRKDEEDRYIITSKEGCNIGTFIRCAEWIIYKVVNDLQ